MSRYLVLVGVAVVLAGAGACSSGEGGKGTENGGDAGSEGTGAKSGTGASSSGGSTAQGMGGEEGGAPTSEAGQPGSSGSGGSGASGGGGSGGSGGSGGGSMNPEGCDLPDAVVSCYTALAPGLGHCIEAVEEGQAADYVRAACNGMAVEDESCPESAEDAAVDNYCIGPAGVITYCYAAPGMPQCDGPPTICTNTGGIYCTP